MIQKEVNSKSRVFRVRAQKHIPVPEVKELGANGFEAFAKAELESNWGSSKKSPVTKRVPGLL